MKRLFSFVSILLILFTCFGYYAPNIAYAQTEYRRVINSTTPFYKSTIDENPLFFLPFSYYVKVLNHNNSFCHVEINGNNGQTAIDGFVPTDQLFYDGQEVISPYLNLYITTIDTAVLYADSNLSSPIQYIFADRSLLYFGETQSANGKLFYVAYNDKLGYVKESDIFPFVIKNHPNKLTFSSAPETNVDEKIVLQSNGFPLTLKTMIIACLLLAGLIALFIALSNKKKSESQQNYYEENDYE